jgi:hypothetical protein
MSPAFELRSVVNERSHARVFLIQLPRRTDRLPVVTEPTTIGRLESAAIDVVWSTVLGMVAGSGRPGRARGARPPTTAPTHASVAADDTESGIAPSAVLTADTTIPLTEPVAWRLLLMCHAAAALRANGTLAQAAAEIAAMHDADVHYWIGKVTGSDADGWRRRFVKLFAERTS